MPGKETAQQRAEREVREGFEGVTDGPGSELAEREARTVSLAKSDGSIEVVSAPDLRELSFNQVAALFGDSIVTADEIIGTDQFGPILEDKGKLVGVPFVIVYFDEYAGDYGKFVSMWVITANDDRYIINDGSSGLSDQLRTLKEQKGITAGIACKHGLRVSEYDKELDNGSTVHAKTYYLDTRL